MNTSESRHPHMEKTKYTKVQDGEPLQEWVTNVSPRVQRRFIQEVTKHLTATSENLSASVASVKVRVSASVITKRRGKNILHCRAVRGKPLLSKKNINAHLSFSRTHLDDPSDFYKNCGLTKITIVN